MCDKRPLSPYIGSTSRSESPPSGEKCGVWAIITRYSRTAVQTSCADPALPSRSRPCLIMPPPPSRRPSGNPPAAVPAPAAAASADPDAVLADTIARHGDDPDFVTALARGLAVLLSLSDKKRRMSIAQVSHRTGIPARGGAAQPAHARQAGLRRRRRRPPLLPAPARAVVLPRLPVGVADRGARPADPRPPGRIAARRLLARARSTATRSSTSRARRRRASCRRRSTSGAGCRRTARRSGTCCSRTCRRTSSTSYLARVRFHPVHRAHADVGGAAAAAARGGARVGLRVREPADGAAPVHAGGAGAGHGRPLRRGHQRHPAGAPGHPRRHGGALLPAAAHARRWSWARCWCREPARADAPIGWRADGGAL